MKSDDGLRYTDYVLTNR